MNKKIEEIRILKSIINEYDKKITILSEDEAKSIFTKYDGDNPDFIVKYNTNYIGIDLFNLVSSTNKNVLKSLEEKKLGIQNLAHLENIREKSGTKLLYENEELGKVVVERINSKVLHKIKNYVTEKIWLLGYANKKYNFRLLEDVIDDNVVNRVLEYVRKNIIYDIRIEKIYLFQCWANNRLFSVL